MVFRTVSAYFFIFSAISRSILKAPWFHPRSSCFKYTDFLFFVKLSPFFFPLRHLFTLSLAFKKRPDKPF